MEACTAVENKEEVAGKFAIATRGQCTFAQKVRHIQDAGATFAIILDNTKDSSYENSALFAMSGDGKDDIEIPAIFLYAQEGVHLTEALRDEPDLHVTIGELKSLKQEYKHACDNDECEPITNANIVPGDEESFDYLKTVLGQLVAQFEMPLSTEAPVVKAFSDNTQKDNSASEDTCEQNLSTPTTKVNEETASSDKYTKDVDKNNSDDF